MCGPCARVWYRPSYAEALEALPVETLQRVRQLWWETEGWLWRVVSALKKAKVPCPREWDEALVSMAITRADDLGVEPVAKPHRPRKGWEIKRLSMDRREPAIWGGSIARLIELTAPTYEESE